MSTAADYVNRTIDLLAFQDVKLEGDALLGQALAQTGNSGMVCTGIQKLAQRWLLEFFTLQGSIEFLTDRGCDFMGQMFRGELRTTLDASQAFHVAAAQVAAHLVAEEADDTPEDESYGSVSLTSLAVSGDKLTLRVNLQSLAGESRIIVLPIGVKVWS